MAFRWYVYRTSTYKATNLVIVVCFDIGTDTIDLASLYRYVIPCVTNWEGLGIQLGLTPHHLDCISLDFAHHPQRTESCCKAVFKKWLQLEISPLWGKLEDAINIIENPPSTSSDLAGKFRLSFVWKQILS